MMNIMNPPADWSTLKKLIWLRGTPITGGEELTVTGQPPLTLPNSLGKPLKAWSVYLLPYQEGSGDPAPDNVRPIHGTDKVTIWTGSQNLFQTTAESKTENGVTWTVNADGSISVSGVATDYTDLLLGESAIDYRWGTITISGTMSATNIVWGSVRLLDDNGTTVYTVSSGGYATSLTVDLTQYPQATKIRIAVKRNNNREVSGVIQPMVNLGSTALPFTPYLAPSQTVITLPSTIYTATIGESGGESRSAYVLLNDPDKWVATSGTVNFMYSAQFMDRKIYNTSYMGITCTYLPVVSRSDEYGRWDSADGYNFGFKSSTLTLDQIKADATAGKIAICYDLDTQVQFPLTVPPIPTPTGTATTWATAEDGTVDSMEVTYVGKA